MTTAENSNFLEDQFLIAMPQMTDPYFANTVTYLWKHNEEGALGIVINKPLQASIADIFDELEIVCPDTNTLFRQQKVLAGGPVERDKGFIVHDSPQAWESSICITPTLSVCTSKSILQDIATGAGPDNYLVALGCAGWEAGQLEQEISDNAWLTTPVDSELIFSQEHDQKTARAATLLGIKLHHLSPEAGHS